MPFLPLPARGKGLLRGGKGAQKGTRWGIGIPGTRGHGRAKRLSVVKGPSSPVGKLGWLRRREEGRDVARAGYTRDAGSSDRGVRPRFRSGGQLFLGKMQNVDDCPLLEFEQDAGASLVERDGVLRWAFANRGELESGSRLVAAGPRSQLVHPGWHKSGLLASRLASMRSISSMKISAQGLLSEKYPEIGLDPFFCRTLNKVILQDYRDEFAAQSTGDHLVGNCLSVAQSDEQRSVKLVFPGGARGNRILTATARLHGDTKPRSTCIGTLSSAVQQIVASSPPNATFQEQNLVAVRSAAGTTVLQEAPHGLPEGSTECHQTYARLDITPEQTEGRAHVHIAMDRSDPSLILITDELGGVWRFEGTSRLRELVQAELQSPCNHSDKWWQAFQGKEQHELIRASRRSLAVIDSRDRSEPSALLWNRHDDHKKTVFAASCSSLTSSSGTYTVAASEQLLWLDDRMPGKPILAAKHYLRDASWVGLVNTHVADSNLDLLYHCKTRTVLAYETTTLHEVSPAFSQDSYLIEHGKTREDLFSKSRIQYEPLVGLQVVHHSSALSSATSIFTLENQGLVLHDTFVSECDLGHDELDEVEDDDTDALSEEADDQPQSHFIAPCEDLEDEWLRYEHRFEDELIGEYPIQNLCRLHKVKLDVGEMKQKIIEGAFAASTQPAVDLQADLCQVLQTTYDQLQPLAVPVTLQDLLETTGGQEILATLTTIKDQNLTDVMTIFCKAIKDFLAHVHVFLDLSDGRGDRDVPNPEDILSYIQLLESTFGSKSVVHGPSKKFMTQACIRAAVDDTLAGIAVFDRDMVDLHEPATRERMDDGDSEELKADLFVQSLLDQWPIDQDVKDYRYTPYPADEAEEGRSSVQTHVHDHTESQGLSSDPFPDLSVQSQPMVVPSVAHSGMGSVGRRTVRRSQALNFDDVAEANDMPEQGMASQIVSGQHGDRRQRRKATRQRREGF